MPTTRPDRAARKRRLRRQRQVAGAAAILTLGGIGLGIGALTRGTTSRPSAVAKRTPGAPRPASSPPARSPVGGLPTLAEQEAAIDRLVKFGLPIYRAGGRGNFVALTFDDGPGPYTTTALAALKKAQARATFFVVGRNLANWPTLPRQEAAIGAVADHTWTHPYLPNLPIATITSEMDRTRLAASAAAGRPVRLFRPPYGGRNAAIDHIATSEGMLEVLWSTDSRDALGANWESILATGKNALRPGEIILFHENRGQTLKALNRLLPELHKRNMVAVSVPELLALDPPSLAQVRADAEKFTGITAGGAPPR